MTGHDLSDDYAEPPEERQTRLLAAAVGILLGDEKSETATLRIHFGPQEVRRAEEWVERQAEAYRYEADLSARSARMKDATATLLRIEKACAELARAFDEASPDAYSVLDGYGPGGANYRHLAWKPRGSGTARDFQTLLAITGQYLLPIGPGHGPEDRVTDMLSIGPEAVKPRTVVSGDRVYTVPGEPVSWSDAAAALGMRIGILREDFDERFQQQDVGGKQEKYSEQVRGDPKWILARECTDVSYDFAEYWSESRLTGGKTGRFARLVFAVYEFATGEELWIKHRHKGKGEGLDGLDNHVRRVISISPRLSALNQKGSNISKEEREERDRLQLFWNTGREPKAPKPSKPAKATEKGKAKKAAHPKAA